MTELETIEASIAAVGAAIQGNNRQADALSAELGALLRRRDECRVAADKDLPRALIRAQDKNYEVVISRRTGVTVYTRYPGGAPETEQAWRQSKYQREHNRDEWHEHPKSRNFGYWNSRTLIVATAGAGGADAQEVRG